MTVPSTARALALGTLAAAATVTVGIGLGLPSLPSAKAATHPTAQPPKVPAGITRAISQDGLSVQSSQGWQAVSGPAAKVDDIRVRAASEGIGTLTEYTGVNETGQAMLIFTGTPGKRPVAFNVGHSTIHSTQNDTGQTWYMASDHGKLDADIAAGTATNVRPVRAITTNYSAATGKVQPAEASFSF